MENRKKILFMSSKEMFEVFVPVMYPGGGFIDKHHYFTIEYEIKHVELYGSTIGLRLHGIIVFLTNSLESTSVRFQDFLEVNLRTRLALGYTHNLMVL